ELFCVRLLVRTLLDLKGEEGGGAVSAGCAHQFFTRQARMWCFAEGNVRTHPLAVDNEGEVHQGSVVVQAPQPHRLQKRFKNRTWECFHEIIAGIPDPRSLR
ncbi:unnamed protein product, partial [Ectocarpus sp. 4 AP-2014]